MDEAAVAPTPYELELDDRYRIFGFAERLRILSQLCERQALIRVLPAGSSEPLISALLFVDADQRALIFDGGRDPIINERLAQAERLTVTTDLDGVRVQFELAGAQVIPLDGRAAFQASVPESVLRLQRREFFRIAPPLNKPILVRLRSDTGLEGLIGSARGVDISCGGMVLLFDGPIAGLEPGVLLPGTNITLPEVATIETGLEVRNVRFSERTGRAGTTRVGCRFTGINQANGARVQRYINRLEIELRRRT